jgi:putative hemolysin
MSGVTTEIVVVLVLILANGVFAMSEIAVVSSRKVRLQQWAAEGNRKAGHALALAEEPTRFLSTVQVGITLVGIFTGAFGGATIAEPLAAYLEQFPLIAPYSNGIALGLVVAVITYLSLIIGELVPKRLGLNHPERIASAVAGPMSILSRIATPVVSLLGISTDLVLRLLGVRPSEEPPVTEEEIEVLIAQGTEVGVFEAAEQDIVTRLFRLADRRVTTLMTPRRKVVWLDPSDSSDENRRKMVEAPHSRLVVAEGHLDNVLGVVHVKDLMASCLDGGALDFSSALREALFVPESALALRVLEQFQQSGVYMALVIDEYGVIQGLVTLTDILEGIVGDLPMQDDPAEQQIKQREDGSWLVDGMLPTHDFKEHFDLDELPGEETGTFQTVGGFVMARLGRIPVSTDQFDWNELCFEVMDMDGNRVDKVLVARKEEAPPDIIKV